jgi:hypothetical protein
MRASQISDSNFKQPDRHCERSEAIHRAAQRKNGLLRRSAPRNDDALTFDKDPRSRGAMRPSFAKTFTPKETRGRRESRVPAAPAAGALFG